MGEKQQEPTQLTQPKQGKPIEIPIPRRDDFERLVTKAAKTQAEDGEEPAT
ncbi:MAG TPA: hypothetical protein VGI24_07600 [Solirubrobacteraceae bacterium]|jgi:hypothetical protein